MGGKSETMTDYESKHIIDIIRGGCIKYNIHEVCFYCGLDCNQGYTPWSGQMPPDIFCDAYEERETEDSR